MCAPNRTNLVLLWLLQNQHEINRTNSKPTDHFNIISKMRCTYLLSLALLLFNSCFNEVNARAASNLQQRALNRDEILDASGQLRLKFIDLNYDVLFITFDELDLTDLVSVASTNSRIEAIAGAVFRMKYGDYKIVIRKLFSIWGPVSKNLSIIDSPTKYIKIEEPTLALTMLQRFGGFISELSTGGNYTKAILENIRVPFEQMESLSISMEENLSDVLPLNHMFPKLREMTIYLNSDMNFSMIDCALPHLNFLSIHVWGDAWNQRNSIEGLIQKNPQIKGIHIYGFPSDYIKVINTMLPNIENVTLNYFNTGGETVTLEHVKYLVLHGKYQRIEKNVRI